MTDIAIEHGGVISRSQALECGLSRHVIDRHRDCGDWQALSGGVYYTESGAVPWLAQAWAGVLIGGAGSALAKRSAAASCSGSPMGSRFRFRFWCHMTASGRSSLGEVPASAG